MVEQQFPKSEWGPGPWQDEPDRVEWNDERTGLACRIIRNMWSGNFCGYAGIPATHPYFGWGYDDDIKLAPGDLKDATINDVGIVNAFFYAMTGGQKHGTIPLGMTLKAHNGLSFAGNLLGESSGLWFFGFDCGHAWDVTPALDMMLRRHLLNMPIPDRQYRDVEYVKKEVTALAFQLRQLETRVLLDGDVLAFAAQK
jgi:hypothetical protein